MRTEDMCRFTQLYAENRAYLYCVAFHIVHNKEDAEDVVSDCMIKILQRSSQLFSMPDERLIPYLVKATRNTAIDSLRHRCVAENNRLHLVECDSFLLSNSHQQPVEETCVERVYFDSCINILPSQERSVTRFLLNQYCYRDIADIMGLSEATVRKYWFLSKQRLRSYIEEQTDN